MKINLIASMIPLSLSIASCQEVADKNYSYEVSVVDEEGTPVKEANVRATRHELVPDSPVPVARSFEVNTSTDPNGVASFSFSSPQTPGGVAITKDGYYKTTAAADWVFPEGFLEAPTGHVGKIATAKIEAVLKPIKSPVPMYAFDNRGAMEKIAEIPEFNREYAFDLMMAEPLPPLGNGKIADFNFKIDGHHDGKAGYEIILKIRFENPEDGVVEFITPQRSAPREPSMLGSAMISDYEAQENGYTRSLERRISADATAGVRDTDVNFHRNFYFRTRTVTDATGNIVSAHYGKIYGDFQFDAANKDWGYLCTLALVTTYFNPTPNDRNVEFDPARNLLPDGSVRQP